MARALVTGFEPFGGEPVNPSWRAVKVLDGKVIGRFEVVAREVPTVFRKSGAYIARVINELRPDIVLSVGQAGSTPAIRVERFALNLDDARGQDNEGNRPEDEPVAKEGPIGYWATVPVKEIAKAINAAGIPAVVSNSAGTFVCNHVFYSALHHVASKGLPVKVGFIHVPYLPEQAVAKPSVASMAAETIAAAVARAIEACG
ncbi:MAG: pyroglutamyl-peptidase I [Bacillota bacterium]|nr:pyroglutamyl-peptidase I [Bacillota bacterium]